MKRLLLAAIAFSAFPSPAWALGVRPVAQNIAEKGFVLEVSPQGLALNFLKVGEQITFVDISHKRDFIVYGDGALCVENDGCSGAPVSILFLKRIKPLAFDGVIPSGDGTTHLFVKTGSPQGSALYQFKLKPASAAKYSVIEIVKNRPIAAFNPSRVTVPKPIPVLIPPIVPPQVIQPVNPPQPSKVNRPQGGPIVAAEPTKTPASTAPTHIRYANAIARSMNGNVRPNSAEWGDVNSAIAILRRGGSLSTAAKRSRVSKARLSELIRRGGVEL